VESEVNPIVSIHTHGWTFKLLSELVETGGLIDLDKLPVGDPTLRQKKSLVTSPKKEWDWLLPKENIDILQTHRSAPMYQVCDVRPSFYFRIKKLLVLKRNGLPEDFWKFSKSGNDR
jgi:phosphoribosylformylglycinamidine synthase